MGLLHNYNYQFHEVILIMFTLSSENQIQRPAFPNFTDHRSNTNLLSYKHLWFMHIQQFHQLYTHSTLMNSCFTAFDPG